MIRRFLPLGTDRNGQPSGWPFFVREGEKADNLDQTLIPDQPLYFSGGEV